MVNFFSHPWMIKQMKGTLMSMLIQTHTPCPVSSSMPDHGCSSHHGQVSLGGGERTVMYIIAILYSSKTENWIRVLFLLLPSLWYSASMMLQEKPHVKIQNNDSQFHQFNSITITHNSSRGVVELCIACLVISWVRTSISLMEGWFLSRVQTSEIPCS